jgi:hypothetical protein
VIFGSADKVTGICLEEKTRTLAFLAKKSFIKMGHPPYSPDSAPAIFGSFRN